MSSWEDEILARLAAQKQCRRAKEAHTLEAAVKKRLKTALEELGAFQFWPVQMGMGAAAVDCLTCVPVHIRPEHVGLELGLFVAIECKRPSVSSPTERQRLTLRKVQEAGGVALLDNDPELTVAHLSARILANKESF
jgi:hypothetical protein